MPKERIAPGLSRCPKGNGDSTNCEEVPGLDRLHSPGRSNLSSRTRLVEVNKKIG